MKQIKVFFILSLFAINAFAQKTIVRSVYFETKKPELSASAKEYLIALSDTLKRYPTFFVELKGHTDWDGSETFNQKLSKERVENVKNTLENNGIALKNIQTAALGEKSPRLENTTKEGKQGNRRVEIAITIYPDNTKISNVANEKSYQNISELYKDLEQPPQYFKVKTGQETTIRGAKGTIFVIPKDAFQGIPENSVIDFQLKEAYSFSDIFAENLNTHSGDKLLQTGGMFYADAQYNGKSLALKKEIKVDFPTKESQTEGMQLFTGVRDANQNGKMDWQPISGGARADNFNDETLTIYAGQNGYDPYLISDKNGHIKFKDLLDTNNLSPKQLLVYAKRGKGDGILVPRGGITKVGSAMAFFLMRNKKYMEKPLLETHKSAFIDAYNYYKVDNFDDLKKQNGVTWDSLTAIRAYYAKNYERFQPYRDSVQRVRDSVQKENQKEYQKFNNTFTLPNLGWINCDRFVNINENELVNVEAKNSENWSISNHTVLIFKTEKMLLNAFNRDKKVSFANIPKGKSAIIVGMRIEKGQPYLALQYITTANMKVDLDYKKLSVEEIKKQLKTLDN